MTNRPLQPILFLALLAWACAGTTGSSDSDSSPGPDAAVADTAIPENDAPTAGDTFRDAAGDPAAADLPAGDLPAADVPMFMDTLPDAPAELPQTDLPAGDLPALDSPSEVPPVADVPAGDAPADAPPATDTPATDTPATETVTADASTVDVPADAPKEISPECAAIKPHLTAVNTLTVGGVARKFLLSVPVGATGPGGRWPVVFEWHGFVGAVMPDSQEFSEVKYWHKNLMGAAVDNDRMPFLLVTPMADGAAMLDWNILDYYPEEAPNPDIELFDAVLACLDAKYGVDPDRIHSIGFSAGGILTDLLGVTRGETLASVLTWSGGYLANPANETGDFLIVWPNPGPSSGYVQVMFEGGKDDQWEVPGMLTAEFSLWNANDRPWLGGLGHDVIFCSHTQGHTIPSGSNPAAYVVDFFQAHPRGTTTSPFAAGLPVSFPSNCTYHPKAE